MGKNRIVSVAIALGLLAAVYNADQEGIDSFQAKRQAEQAGEAAGTEAEGGQDTECLEEENDLGQTEAEAEGEEENDLGQTEAEAEGEEESDLGQTEAETKEDTRKRYRGSYHTAYRRFLEAYMEEEDAHTARATLALIDDDNIPELLLMKNDCHAEGVEVYTYDQGSVVELGGFGSFGRMQYVERGGMILSAEGLRGECYTSFYQVEDKEARKLCETYTYSPPDLSSVIYEIDGAGVTEEVFQKKWQELHDAYEYVLIGYEDAFAIDATEEDDWLRKATDALLITKDSSPLTEMAEMQSEALEGYAAFLEWYVLQGKESGKEEAAEWMPAYSLIYLDGDDVPELVMIGGYEYPWGVSVYTFEEGKTISVGTYGQYAELHYREKEGIIFDDHDRFGNVYCDVYQVEGSRRTLLQSLNEGESLAGYEQASEEGEWHYTYEVDGKEASEEEYRAAYEKWYETKYKVIDYDMCRKITDGEIRKHLTQELGTLILTQEEVLKQNVLIAAGAQEDDILLWDYDDYDGDGRYEAFVIVGNIITDKYGNEYYNNDTLCFAGEDGCSVGLNVHGSYRAIDGKMDFGERKYLFFYSDYCVTANISEIWTVEDGKPVEKSGLLQAGQVVYRGGDEFEIWVDAYDHYCEKEAFSDGSDMWTGHTWKPYFYHYNRSSDQLEAYAGEQISKETFDKLSGTNIIEEIEAKGYTVGEIIRWENDIITINYHYVKLYGETDPTETYYYEHVIWDNNKKGYWRKAEWIDSWENAGVGGSYGPRNGKSRD